MSDREATLAASYLFALVAAFAAALATLAVPGVVESVVGPERLTAVRLGCGFGLIGLLALADRFNERFAVGGTAGERSDDERRRTSRTSGWEAENERSRERDERGREGERARE